MLERREWKAYRADMRQWLHVKTCGRNFFRFCDTDGNRKITREEWLRCTVDGLSALLSEKPQWTRPQRRHRGRH